MDTPRPAQSGTRELARQLFYLLELAIIAPLALIAVVFALMRRGSGAARDAAGQGDARVLLVTPFAPGAQSGGAKAVQDLLGALRPRFAVTTYEVPRTHSGGRLRQLLGSLLFRALVIPDPCRRIAFGHAPVREASAAAGTVVFEFFATAVYLWFGSVRSPRVVIRDHEVLLRKFGMEFAAARGLARGTWLLRVATCYLVSLVVYTRAHCIITLTDQDRQAIARAFPWCAARTVHIPAPFEPAAMSAELPLAANGQVRDLMMLGNFFHSPNVDGLLWFLRECAPHLSPGYRLHLCGLDGPLVGLELSAPGLSVIRHGFLEDEARVGALAPIAIAPIVSGGGVRIKNLYLASMGKALVTTPLGNEGIDFIDGQHAIICNDGRTMAAQIDALAADPQRIGRIATHARSHVHESFRPDVIFTRLVTALCGTTMPAPGRTRTRVQTP